jgi:predicted small lipoprotein YifL
MKTAMKVFAGLAALALLAGCGIKGGLERPNPMWNADSARAAEAQRRDERTAERAERNARRGVSEAPPMTSSNPIVEQPAPPPAAQ